LPPRWRAALAWRAGRGYLAGPMLRFLALIAVFLSLHAAPAAAQLLGPQRVQVEFRSARAAVAPGETFTVVMRQRIEDHWHTYWRNPGAAGEPPELTWTSPPGFEAGPLQWPAPDAIEAVGLMNYGYSNEVLLPIEMRASPNARPGETAQFSINVYLVVCSDDTCIPEESTVTLAQPIEAQGRDDPEWAPRIAEVIANLPRRDDALTAHITAGTPPTLSVALTGISDPYFFPFNRDVMNYDENQTASIGAEGFSIALPPGVQALGEAPLEGLLTFTDASGARRAVEFAATPGPVLPGTAGAPQAQAEPLDVTALLIALAFAFLGGLILNVMPCVLPVLSVKALAFAGGGHSSEARRQGVFYFVGVMATFLVLAGALIAFRGAGETLGWGFQLQAPWVTSSLALLFFVIGLNLLGVFEIGGGAQNLGAGLTTRGGDAGAFFTGALAVVAATPCTAPFMASAIGVALTQPAPVTLLIFASLALGFALPLTALHFVPALQRVIPKPGVWMERVRNVLAFPMFGAAIWLVWVFTAQTDADGTVALLSVAAALGLLLFVARWGRVWLALGVIAFLVTAAIMWRPLVGLETQAALTSEPWSPARVTELRSEGRGVFVNFTAAWCITCKVNENGAFASPRVARGFADENVTYLVADWTNRDDTIAAALAEHGRAGVPMYLYYPPEGDVRVLPQVLTEGLILETISGDAE
jgi:thiol:disulfide interchange protein/DsbC/DsbD-like thiol-disulfide interchange protein